jgi:hypothetical protein
VVDEPLTPRGISALDPNERLMNFDTAGCRSCKAPIQKLIAINANSPQWDIL